MFRAITSSRHPQTIPISCRGAVIRKVSPRRNGRVCVVAQALRMRCVNIRALMQKVEYIWFDGQEGQSSKVRRGLGRKTISKRGGDPPQDGESDPLKTRAPSALQRDHASPQRAAGANTGGITPHCNAGVCCSTASSQRVYLGARADACTVLSVRWPPRDAGPGVQRDAVQDQVHPQAGGHAGPICLPAVELRRLLHGPGRGQQLRLHPQVSRRRASIHARLATRSTRLRVSRDQIIL